MDLAEWGPYLFALAAGLAGWFLHKLYDSSKKEELRSKLDRANNDIMTLTHELNRHRDASKETITRLEAASMNLKLSNDELSEQMTMLNEQLSLPGSVNNEIDGSEIEASTPKDIRFEPFNQDENSVKSSIVADSASNNDKNTSKKKSKIRRRKKLKAKLNEAKNKISDLEKSLSKIKPKKITFVDLDTSKKKKKASKKKNEA
jgi:hypothetical protein